MALDRTDCIENLYFYFKVLTAPLHDASLTLEKLNSSFSEFHHYLTLDECIINPFYYLNDIRVKILRIQAFVNKFEFTIQVSYFLQLFLFLLVEYTQFDRFHRI